MPRTTSATLVLLGAPGLPPAVSSHVVLGIKQGSAACLAGPSTLYYLSSRTIWFFGLFVFLIKLLS